MRACEFVRLNKVTQHSTAFSRRPLEQRHVRAWHGHGMASVDQKRPHCVNQMGKTHYKPLVARHGRRMAWVRHRNSMLSVYRSLCFFVNLLTSSTPHINEPREISFLKGKSICSSRMTARELLSCRNISPSVNFSRIN